MLRRPPISTRADILFPYTALVRAGGKVVAAMRRAAKPGEFRSNLHRGGTATAAKLSPQERELAVRAAKVMGLGVAGVDMLRSNRSEEHTSELQSLMRSSYAVFCLNKKKTATIKKRL